MKYFYRDENLSKFLKYQTQKRSKCICCNKSKFIYWTSIFEKKMNCLQCKFCGFVFMNPYTSNKGLKIYYNNYLQKRRLSNQKKMIQRDRQYELDSEFISKQINSGKILDIGCNGGFFLEKLSNNFEKYGIDVDKEAIKFGKKNFKFKKNLINNSFLKHKYPKNYFDCVVLRGTIEHLADPEPYIKKIYKILKKKGKIFIIATPNISSVSAKIFKKHWTLFHPIQHLSHFSVNNLEILFKKYKFKLSGYEYPYLGTPYENILKDLLNFFWCFVKLYIIKENKDGIMNSPPFFRNMMSVSFIKK